MSLSDLSIHTVSMKLIILILLGAALAIGAMGWAWRVAPLTAHAEDLSAIMAAAAESEVRAVGRDSDVVYVLPSEVASTLRIGTRLRVEPWTRRPEGPECVRRGAARVAAAPCERDDYVHVSVQSIPFWTVALVSVSTQGGHHEKLVIKLGSKWVVVGTRGYAV